MVELNLQGQKNKLKLYKRGQCDACYKLPIFLTWEMMNPPHTNTKQN